jgi:hypothetical protein
MQLSKSDELYPIQRLLWRSLGLSDSTKAAELQAADLARCLAAARTICLKTVSAALLHILSTTALGSIRICMQSDVGFVKVVWCSMGVAAVAALARDWQHPAESSAALCRLPSEQPVSGE